MTLSKTLSTLSLAAALVAAAVVLTPSHADAAFKGQTKVSAKVRAALVDRARCRDGPLVALAGGPWAFSGEAN